MKLESLLHGPSLGGGVIGYIIFAVFLYLVSVKVGEKDEWMSFVPFLNLIQLAKVARKNPLLGLAILIPCVGLIPLGIAFMGLAERRGKSGLVGLLLFIPVVNLVVAAYLALGD